jgi:imidazole glycerol-phosphate synthase subunit HisF
MSRVRIIPVLLLRKGGLYKTVRFKNAVYVGDPINTVKIFNEKEADELVVLDYNASLEGGSIDYKKIAEIAGEAFMPMGYGGGIRTLEDAKKVFDAGYEKVVLNSVLFNDLSLIEKIGNIYGAQAVVCAIDVKKNLLGKVKVYSHSGTKSTSHSPVEWAKQLETSGAGEILLNVVEQDGTWNGYDLELIKLIAPAVNIPLIACGGAANTGDFVKAVGAGASAVAAGSMFVYQRKGMGVLISFPTGFSI